MSKTTNEITSPLQIVSSQQIEDLIFEEKLRNEGYKFCYTIEMKDIGDYCFPWGVYGNDIKDIDYTADILSTYEDFLFDMNTDIIFLDQYLFELLNLRNLILKIKERVGEIGNETKGFINYLNKNTLNERNLDFYKLGAYLSTVMDGTQKFNRVIKKLVMNYEEFEKFPNGENSLMYRAMQQSAPNDYLTNQIFSLVQEKKIFGTYYSTGKEDVLSNKRTDSEVIGRLITINKYLIDKAAKEKYLMCFISSSSTSKRIFEEKEIKGLLPFIKKNRIFNFHRDINQLYIQFYLKNHNSKDRKTELDSILKIVKNREENQKIDVKVDKKIKEGFDSRIHLIREKYIHNQLLTQKIYLQQLIDKIKEIEKEKQFQGTFSKYQITLKKYLDFIELKENEIKIEKEIEQLKRAFSIEQTFMYFFKNGIDAIAKNESKFIISRGHDHIKGAAQHLPIFFRTTNDSEKKIFNAISQKYLESIIKVSNEQQVSINKNNLNEIVLELYKKHEQLVDTRIEKAAVTANDLLIYCLLIMMMPQGKLIKQTNDKIVYDFLFDIYTESKTNNEEISTGLLYILSWVARRIKNYENALIFAEEGNTKDTTDARFIHSKFLINYCLFEENRTKYNAIENSIKIKELLKLINEAISGYEKMFQNNKDATDKFIFDKQNDALFNSKAYHLTELYAFDRNNDNLIEARKLIDSLKEHDNETYRDAHPEYLHTEAFLEFYETDEIEENSKKFDKINNAWKAIKKSIEKAKPFFSIRDTSYESLKDTISTKRQQLIKVNPEFDDEI